MSTTKKTSKTVRHLGTVEDLPEANMPHGHSGASHWRQIAETVEAQPGIWHKFQIGTISVNAQRAGASAINAASTHGKGGIISFRKPGFRAAFREGVLHVRYDAPAVAKLRRAQ